MREVNTFLTIFVRLIAYILRRFYGVQHAKVKINFRISRYFTIFNSPSGGCNSAAPFFLNKNLQKSNKHYDTYILIFTDDVLWAYIILQQFAQNKYFCQIFEDFCPL